MTDIADVRRQAEAVPLPEGFRLNVFELGPNNTGLEGVAFQMEVTRNEVVIGQMMVVGHDRIEHEDIGECTKLLVLELELLLDNPPEPGEVQIRRFGGDSQA